MQRPNGIAWFNNKLYTACTGDGTVYEIDDTTGADARLHLRHSRMRKRSTSKQDAQNNLTLWVPDYQANTLTKVTRSGVETVARNLHGPWGIAYVDEQHFLLTNLLEQYASTCSAAMGTIRFCWKTWRRRWGLFMMIETLYVANYGSTRRSIEWYRFDAVLNGADQTPATSDQSCPGQRACRIRPDFSLAAMATVFRLCAWQSWVWSGGSIRRSAWRTAAAPTIRSRSCCYSDLDCAACRD